MTAREHRHSPDAPEIHNLDTRRSPEESPVFRIAQLVILLDEIAPKDSKGIDLERIAYYDFFAANPFAIFGDDDLIDRARLHRSGFDERQLSYASTGPRFANRRRRLQHDFSLLVAYGFVAPRGDGYGIAPRGTGFAQALTALYADQYRESVRVIHRRFKKLSDRKLAELARQWLQTPPLLLDLYGSWDISLDNLEVAIHATPLQNDAENDI